MTAVRFPSLAYSNRQFGAVPKLGQFWPKLEFLPKLESVNKCSKTSLLSQDLAAFPDLVVQIWPKLPKLAKNHCVSITNQFGSVYEKDPSPYGRECPYGGNSPGSMVFRLSHPLSLNSPTGDRMEQTTPKSAVKDSLTTQPRQSLRQPDSAGHSRHSHATLLCLDLGTTTGWALSSRSGNITSGTVSFKPRRFEGGGMRYLRFERWLGETNDLAGGIDAVSFEEVRRHLGVDAAHAYGGFLGALTAWCEENSIPYEGVPVGTIKKFITGKGNAGKSDVIRAVQALGHHPADDNEADALAILYWARQQHTKGRNAG